LISIPKEAVAQYEEKVFTLCGEELDGYFSSDSEGNVHYFLTCINIDCAVETVSAGARFDPASIFFNESALFSFVVSAARSNHDQVAEAIRIIEKEAKDAKDC